MQNKFNTKDSSISFILAITLPNVLAFFILILAGIVTGDITKIESTIFYKILATTLSQIVFLSVYFFIIKRKKIKILDSIEKEKLNFKQILILLLISLICLFLISPIINVFDAFLLKLGISAGSLPINLNDPLNFVYLLLTLGVLAPICEELIFRGIIFNGLKEKGNKTAVLISSLMFMLVHLNLSQTFYQLILGIILALVVLYTNNIFSGILIHIINNSLVLVINYINPLFFDYRFLTTNYIILALVLLFLAAILIYKLLEILKKSKKIDRKNKNIEKIELKTKNSTKDYYIFSIVFGIILWFVSVLLSL